MTLPHALAATTLELDDAGTNLATLQTAIDALPASPTTDQLVPVVQSLKDITTSLQTCVTTFVAVIRTTRISG